MDGVASGAQPVAGLLSLAGTRFPATVIYNESWLLRLLLAWSTDHGLAEGPLGVPQGCTWYSEAMLPSAFLPRRRGDPLGETWTHADAVVGQFRVGAGAKADLSLAADAACLTVIEAKLFSPLCHGVSHAPYFDQAARSVACMAEVLHRANRTPDSLSLAFRVLAPQSQTDGGTFACVSADSIQAKVERRVAAYDGERQDWFDRWFAPTLALTRLSVFSWEEAIGAAGHSLGQDVSGLDAFYRRCLAANAATAPGRLP